MMEEYYEEDKPLIEEEMKEYALAHMAAMWRDMLKTYEGRATVYDLFQYCGLNSDPFTQGQPDVTAHRLGIRNAGLWVLEKVLTNAPETYIIMQSEYEDRQRLYLKEALATPEGDENDG